MVLLLLRCVVTITGGRLAQRQSLSKLPGNGQETEAFPEGRVRVFLHRESYPDKFEGLTRKRNPTSRPSGVKSLTCLPYPAPPLSPPVYTGVYNDHLVPTDSDLSP